ncbi:MAG: hypothetical protein HKN25_07415 [Pyrinomonadaceae bacterium]|nr:hypothetical protein [Pyrinomonadaceae bacterium]
MKSLIYLFDHRLNLITLILLFWCIFWGLNGFDKFFNGKNELNLENWSTKGRVVDQEGQVVYKIKPYLPKGWFGINYDNKVANYFKTLGVPRSAALGMLYTFAVFEILIAFLFLSLFIWQLLPESREDRKNMFSDRTLHRIAFKASVSMFVILSIAYQLFGDRASLWETGTYLAMTLIAYDMWYRSDRFFLDLRKKRLKGIDDDDDSNSFQASAYNLKVESEDK